MFIISQICALKFSNDFWSWNIQINETLRAGGEGGGRTYYVGNLRFHFLWQDLDCNFTISMAQIIFPLRNLENDRQQMRDRLRPTYIPFITLIAPPRS